MSTKYVQMQNPKLQSAIDSSATEAVFTGFVDLAGDPLTQTDFGTTGYGTLEPNTSREEVISFTIDSNSGGTATLTIVRGLQGKAPYGTGGTAHNHEAQSELVISNNPELLNKLTAKDNDETITGSWKYPVTPTHNQNPATKKHVEDTTVQNTGDETIAGEKTFSTAPKIPDSAAADEALTRGEFDAEAVTDTGNQTIAGTKTFSTSPKVPDATAADEPYTKGQHDADAAAYSSVASPTVRGSAKLRDASATPLDPKVLSDGSAINESERSVDPVDDENKLVKLEDGGRISSLFVTSQYFFNNPTDGTIILDGTNTYSDIVDKDGTTYTLKKHLHAEELEVQSGVILDTNGYIIKAKKMYGAGTISFNGNNAQSIDYPNNGNNVALARGGYFRSVGGAFVTSTSSSNAGADFDACIGNDGVQGGDATSGTTVSAPPAGVATPPANAVGSNLIELLLGAELQFASLDEGGANRNAYNTTKIFAPAAQSGTGAYAGDGGNQYTGFAGATGGLILIFAESIKGTLAIHAKGGNGGSRHRGNGNVSTNGGQGGGGGGGTGGAIILVYERKDAGISTDVTGGNGGTAEAGGEAGENGLTGVVYEIQI